jgi:hypothetical protein
LQPARYAAQPCGCPRDGSRSPPSRVSASDQSSCAIVARGRVACWGDNSAGQLGVRADRPLDTIDVGVSRYGAAPVRGVAGAVRVGAAGYRTCALLKTGRVACWGSGSELVSRPRVVLQRARHVIELSADGSCWLQRGGRIACAGDVERAAQQGDPSPRALSAAHCPRALLPADGDGYRLLRAERRRLAGMFTGGMGQFYRLVPRNTIIEAVVSLAEGYPRGISLYESSTAQHYFRLAARRCGARVAVRSWLVVWYSPLQQMAGSTVELWARTRAGFRPWLSVGP